MVKLFIVTAVNTNVNHWQSIQNYKHTHKYSTT